MGNTSAAIFDAVLHSVPPAAGRVNPALPPELDHIISKLLEKDVDLRYQTAGDLRADLKRLHREEGPCEKIKQACLDAGFVFRGAKAGNGFATDCTIPIIQGTPQPATATIPLPHIAPRIVTACKIRNPKFGQPVQGGGANSASTPAN